MSPAVPLFNRPKPPTLHIFHYRVLERLSQTSIRLTKAAPATNSSRPWQSRKWRRSQNSVVAHHVIQYPSSKFSINYSQLLDSAQTPHIFSISSGTWFLSDDLLASSLGNMDGAVRDGGFMKFFHLQMHLSSASELLTTHKT